MSETNVDFERLSLFLDGVLPPAEAAEVERLIADDPEWKAAFRTLKTTGEMMRAQVDRAVEATEPAAFDKIWSGIERGLPTAAPVKTPGFLERLRGFLSPPVMIGFAAAAAAAVYVASRPATAPAPSVAPSPTPGLAAPPPVVAVNPVPASAAAGDAEDGPVIIESVQTEGTKTVLVSQPADGKGATVIWLLDAPVEGEKKPGAPAAGTSDDDPI